MSIESAKEWLSEWSADGRVQEYDQPSATVAQAAATIGCEEKEIAKTLSVITPDGPKLIVVAGDARLDNHKYKAAFGCKAKMIPSENLVELVGHPAGGVSPFGYKVGVPVYLDESLKRFEKVWPACGSPNSAIQVSLSELELFSKASGWVDVTVGWGE